MRLLLGLTQRQRAAIVLTGIEGFDYGQAGAMLGVKESTVRSLVSQARARFPGEWMTTMSDQELLDRAERAARSVALPNDRFDDLLRRRDRKRRNQRIAAGVVGIAVFVAAVWIVTTGVASFEQQPDVGRSRQGTVTGPARPDRL